MEFLHLVGKAQNVLQVEQVNFLFIFDFFFLFSDINFLLTFVLVTLTKHPQMHLESSHPVLNGGWLLLTLPQGHHTLVWLDPELVAG